jgi:hypothetical protein
MLHMQFTALVLTAITLAISSCGSSKTNSSSTSTVGTETQASTTTSTTATTTTGSEEIKIHTGKPLTRIVWISNGDAICARANVKINSTKAKTQNDFDRVFPQAAAYERAEATELSKLVPPSTMASDWRQIVSDLQKYGEFTAKAGEYAQANNFQGALPIIAAADTTERQLKAVAKRDGFKACST